MSEQDLGDENVDVGAQHAPAVDQRSRVPGCLIAILIAVVLVILGGIAWYFWSNRPIEPVELSAQENEVLEAKIEGLQEGEADRGYERGEKELIITERELNGLMNQNTGMGEQVRFELVKGAVHARIETDLDDTLPLVGGKRLKARARFFVDTKEGRPSLVLDDVTVWGASLPNDWLAGLKGKDILNEVFGSQGAVRGIEDLRIEDERLIIRLAE